MTQRPLVRPVRPVRTLAACVMALCLAGLLMPQTAQAREISGSLTYRDRAALPEDAQVMIVLRNAMGDIITEERFDTAGRQVPFDFSLPYAPEGTLQLQAGVFADGKPLRVSPSQDIPAGSEDIQLSPLLLEPYVALGFSTRLRCGRTEVELGFIDQNARLRLGREVFDLIPAPAGSGTLFMSESVPQTYILLDGNTALLSLRGRELPECLPSTGPEFLPIEARGVDTTWSLRIDRETLIFQPDPGEPEITAITPVAVVLEGDAGEVAGLRYDLPEADLRVLLRDRICTGAGPLPRPVSVSVEEGGQMSEGCGGDPMALLSGGEWIVQYAGGIEIAPEQGLTILFGPGRISGASGCNRYSGGLVLRDRGLAVAGVAMTRRACDPARMDLEAEFIKQMPQVAGFTLSDDGRLHLTDSAGNVLISAQR